MVEAARPLTFSTRGVPAPSRIRALRGLREQGLIPIEPLPGAAAHVELVKWRLPGASVLWGRLDGVRQVAEEGAGGSADDLFFGINLAGDGLAGQRGRETPIGAGDALAVRLRNGPFSVLRPSPTRFIGVRVPYSPALADVDRLDDGGPRLVPGRTEALGLLTRYLRSLSGSPAPSSPQLSEAVATHLTELIAFSLGSGVLPAHDRSVGAARMQAIKADIERHLTDRGLSASVVAGRHGITTRYLHKLFEQERQTYSRFVLDRRLDLAHRLLGNPRFADRSVSAIAHDTGFGDLSYFNRTFRRRFDTTPSEARRR
jgi:AraC-like DNA-binding protein